jgi:Cft2 family RNA processing exonuclease
MRFINLTAHTEIGANAYFLEFGGKKILLDAGLHPKREGLEALPHYRLLDDEHEPLGAILISHAHQDHIGSLPWIMRRQPQAPVFMTEATARLSEVMLHNSVNVMQRQRDEQRIAEYPLFTHREIDKAVTRWQRLSSGQRWTFNGERAQNEEDEPTFEFYDSGHIIGAVGILFRVDGRKIFYTGDVNFIDQTLARRAAFPLEKLDVLIIESTRGDRPDDPDFTRKREEERFLTEIKGAFKRGGSVLVPVFALGKTQEVLTMIYRFRQTGQLSHTPVYIGGLSTKITTVHDDLARAVSRQLSGLQLLPSIDPFVLSAKEVATTQIQQNRIYAMSSGMMTEKTLSNILAARFLSDPKHSIFFVGYADPDSPGGRLKRAQFGDEFRLDKDLPSQKLACTIKEFDFSAHASRETLLNYVRQTAPATVLLVHGDPPSVNWFRESIGRELADTTAIIPEPGKAYEV